MDSVGVALDRVWPAELSTDRLLLRPVTDEDGFLVRELLTDDRVRAHLGGPATEERVAARQAASPKTAGTWAVVQVADQRAIGLAALAPEDLAWLCPDLHGAYGRICARPADHTPELHVGRAPDGAWIAWLTSREA